MDIEGKTSKKLSVDPWTLNIQRRGDGREAHEREKAQERAFKEAK